MLNDGNACSRGTHEVKTWTARGRLCAHHISHLYKIPTLSRPHWGTEKMLKDMVTITVKIKTEVHICRDKNRGSHPDNTQDKI